MKRLISSWLIAAAAACTGGGSPSQVLTGTVAGSDAVAVRAVSAGAVVTASRIHSDGTFTLAVPAGKNYALEVLTTGGTVRRLISGGGSEIAFDVCQPSDPYDMGGIGSGSGEKCPPPPPPPCDPSTDPNCKLPPPPPPPCDPTQDPSCTLPPPPCTDPSDPSTCKDPCMSDPQACACSFPTMCGGSGSDTGGSGSGSGSGTGCWPPPLPGCGMVPDHPPGDFGCKGPSGS